MSSDPVTGKEWNGISMFVHRSDLNLFLWIDFFFFFENDATNKAITPLKKQKKIIQIKKKQLSLSILSIYQLSL